MQRNKIYLLAEKKKRGFYNPRFRLGFQSVFSFLPDINIHARTDVYENLHAAGVVDPAKVARVPLKPSNASSARM